MPFSGRSSAVTGLVAATARPAVALQLSRSAAWPWGGGAVAGVRYTGNPGPYQVILMDIHRPTRTAARRSRQAHAVAELSREELAEFSAHCYAKWRSARAAEPTLVLRSTPAGAAPVFYVQLESECDAATPLSSVHSRELLATYVAEQPVFHVETSVSRALEASIREQLAAAGSRDSLETAQAMRDFAALQELQDAAL